MNSERTKRIDKMDCSDNDSLKLPSSLLEDMPLLEKLPSSLLEDMPLLEKLPSSLLENKLPDILQQALLKEFKRLPRAFDVFVKGNEGKE